MKESISTVRVRVSDLRDAADASVFGGKAFGLSRLIAAGLRVPPGFAVEATNLAPSSWAADDRTALRDRAARLLLSGPVAVRSSAIGEDSVDRSYAGLYDTVLDITNVTDVLSAAARCIDSAAAPRTRVYGDSAASNVGVVVQTQVAASVAGVCFTVDPSGRDDAVVIEAVADRGEALASGRKQPQRWRAYLSGLGRWKVVDDMRANSIPVPEDALVEIASQAVQLARSTGRPVDLEWAIDADGILWWLQLRPVTAASPPLRFHIQRALDSVDDGPVTVWANWNIRETLPDPIKPLTWSIWRDAVLPDLISDVLGVSPSAPAFRHLFFLDVIHGRVYFNMNALLACPFVGRALASSIFDSVDPRAAAICRELLSEGALRPRRLPGASWRRSLKAAFAGAVNFRRLLAALRPRSAMRRWQQVEAAVRRRTAEYPIASLGDRALCDEIRLPTTSEFSIIKSSWHHIAIATLIFDRATAAFRAHPEAAQLLGTGIPNNPTTEISLEVEGLANAAKPLAADFAAPARPALLLRRLGTTDEGRAWLRDLSRFLDRFGHRSPKEFDLAVPRWRDDADMIVELVRATLRSSPVDPLTPRIQRLGMQRKAAIADAVASAPWWKRPVLRQLARLVEHHMPMREVPKHYVMLLFQRWRQAVVELGVRFESRGLLGSADDIFFLEVAEIRQLIDGHLSDTSIAEMISDRRSRFERFCSEHPPAFLRSDGVPVQPSGSGATSPEDATLRGIGVSMGRGSGPVKILRSPDPRLVATGDVLVMEFADPGWTPLFTRATAIVVEVGGLMCHAAVVARELGVPAVFGVDDATLRLRDGQRVSVDGATGSVSVDDTQ